MLKLRIFLHQKISFLVFNHTRKAKIHLLPFPTISTQVVLTKGYASDFPAEIVLSHRRHFWFSQFGNGYYRYLLIEVRDAAEYPIIPRRAPTTKNYLA